MARRPNRQPFVPKGSAVVVSVFATGVRRGVVLGHDPREGRIFVRVRGPVFRGGDGRHSVTSVIRMNEGRSWVRVDLDDGSVAAFCAARLLLR